MKFIAAFAFALGTALSCGPALSQPTGGFYLFKHKDNGKVVCFQHIINSDWERLSGPFRDAECKTEQKPKPARGDLPANPLDLAPRK
ncbi:hypothetical protein [Variovorax paradoxus]|uniref:hypothetical protein n=1 Tax=Variovorax paradoxus TaxID=34073 RepID=UPI0019328A0F|nr:hypothetical protein INQ48_26550 [Variovorax paradoxus]